MSSHLYRPGDVCSPLVTCVVTYTDLSLLVTYVITNTDPSPLVLYEANYMYIVATSFYIVHCFIIVIYNHSYQHRPDVELLV